MPVRVMSRGSRGCGQRHPGGTYLFFEATAIAPCFSLPAKPPEACPCCGNQIEFFRAVKAINPSDLLPKCLKKYQVLTGEDKKCGDGTCPVCYPPQRGAIMWVGEKYYSPESFIEEGMRMGISKRIPYVPEGLKVGDPVYFLHKKGFKIQQSFGDIASNEIVGPGFFLCARLTEVQRIVTKDQAKDEAFIRELEEKGLIPVLEVGEEDFETPALPTDEEDVGACD